MTGPRQSLTGRATVTLSLRRREPMLCRGPALGKNGPWLRAFLCRGLSPRQKGLYRGLIFAKCRPSAKMAFAECPRFGPRQRLLPSAAFLFAVVLVHIRVVVMDEFYVCIFGLQTVAHMNVLKSDCMCTLD